MKIILLRRLVTAVSLLVISGLAWPLLAQDVAITNARIIIGNGEVIESGTLVVRDGRITEVMAGQGNTRGLQAIDGSGMTAMPGFIDAHRHINTGPDEKAEMQAQLEAGYTTILSGGGPAEGNLMLREHIESGAINGPRIIPSGRITLADHTPDSARAEVRKLAEMGFEVSVTGGLYADDLGIFKGIPVKCFIAGRGLYGADDPAQAARDFKDAINKYW